MKLSETGGALFGFVVLVFLFIGTSILCAVLSLSVQCTNYPYSVRCVGTVQATRLQAHSKYERVKMHFFDNSSQLCLDKQGYWFHKTRAVSNSTIETVVVYNSCVQDRTTCIVVMLVLLLIGAAQCRHSVSYRRCPPEERKVLL